MTINLPICLRPRRANGRPLARIQRTKLDAREVNCLRHRTAQCVDFPGQMALADAADGRVAAHLAQRCDVLRDQKRIRTCPCGRQ